MSAISRVPGIPTRPGESVDSASCSSPPPTMSLAASTPVRVVFFLLAVALLPACASSGPAAPDLDPRLLGVWADLDGATHTISLVDEGYAVGVVDSDGNTIPVARRTLGVRPSGGIVTAKSRADLAAGRVDGPPRSGHKIAIASVLYDRKRPGYPGAHWIHDTPEAHATLDKRNPPAVYLEAPSETRCDMEGDFLCSASDPRSTALATSRRSRSKRKSNPPRKRFGPDPLAKGRSAPPSAPPSPSRPVPTTREPRRSGLAWTPATATKLRRTPGPSTKWLGL